MIEVVTTNHSNQVIITLNHFQENLQSGLDLSAMAQSELLMKGKVSIPTNLRDSDMLEVAHPCFYSLMQYLASEFQHHNRCWDQIHETLDNERMF